MKIHEAITAVMRSVTVVRKEDRNTTQNFSFRGIDSVLKAVGPALREHGVIVAPYVLSHDSKTVLVGRNQTPMEAVLLLVRYTFTGPEGDTLEAVVPGQAMDAGDKSFSKAMSVAFRTALLQTLALPTDEPDPDMETFERARPSRPTAARPPKTAADIARDDLRAKIVELKLDPSEVAARYLAEEKTALKGETRDHKIAAFTERLGR